jgi:hypothetical protein
MGLRSFIKERRQRSWRRERQERFSLLRERGLDPYNDPIRRPYEDQILGPAKREEGW